MSVKSNDGGGGDNSARPAVMLQISLLSCVFLVLYGGSMGGIVQSVTPSMPGELNSMCVLVLLFIFKLHFLDTCFSHVQCGVYIPGVHTVGG